MDANALLQCFAGTLDQEVSIRTNAESHLKQASTNPGFLGACLDIISSSEVPENIKLSASLYFKNKISYGWNDKNASKNELLNYVVDNDEKPIVKDMLVQAMLHCSKQSPSCVRILKSALTVIISEEYPNKRWDSLLPKSLELLSGNDLDMAYVGLICLSEVFRTYRWQENDARQDLEILIMQYFPDLLQFAETNLFQNGANMNNQKIGEMVKLIIKIYKFVTYYDMPFSLQRPESFTPWANFFVRVIQEPLSEVILSISDTDVRSNNPWVKCKKWSYANLYRLFQRYASQSLSRKFSYEEFKSLYIDQFLPDLLGLLFQQIEQWGNGTLWLSNESIYYILSFIEQTIVQKSTWKLVKPHYSTILQHVIFRLLCPNEDTLDTFENDPQEYIHRNLELWDDSYSPDLAAISLLTTSVSKRGKTTLEPTLEFVIITLQANVGDFKDVTLERAIKIESCLRIFSSILDRLTVSNSPYLSEIEGFLSAFVFPFFNSPFGFLRTRVCEICSKLGMMEFRESSIVPTIYQGTIKCLNEEGDSLPVKLLAALALQAFINDPQFQEPLSNVVVPTMQKLLDLSNEFESDAISGVMQDFVEQFAEQLQPFGVELMNNLVQQFLKLAIDLFDASNFDPNNFINSEDIPDESDKQMAALGILSTTISILLSFENSPDIIKSLEQSFYPAAEFILKNSIEDFYRECCEFVENSTFLLRDVSPISWKVLELIGECNNKEDSMVAFYLEDFMLVISNYLVYGKEELKKNEFYTRILFDIYKKAIASEESTLDELNVIFDLSQKLIVALDDKVPPQYRQQFLEDAVKAILVEKDGLRKNIVFGVTSFNVIVASLISSPLVTLQFLQQKTCLELFFETWFSFYIPNYKRVYDVKLSLVALLSISCTIQAQEGTSLNLDTILVQIGTVIAQLIARFPATLKSLEEKRKEYSSGDYSAGGYNDWEDGFEDDDENEEPTGEDDIKQYMEMLKNDSNALKFVNGDAFGDSDDFDDLEEDPLTGSILDEVNIYDVFKSSINHLQQSDANKYQVIVGNMSADDQNVFAQLMNL